MRTYLRILLVLLLTMILATPVRAQYFGRNKVHYEHFNFRVLHTKHFHIYYYPEEATAVEDASMMLERWYARLSTVMHHELSKPQPIILYANHADFQQTNVIGGLISQGTGGVTEGVENRIVIPFTGVHRDDNHVLGHELVHAFQYDIARTKDEGISSTSGIPLWFIEGMAEYLSLGRDDPQTAMWMRDAVLYNDVPSISDIGHSRKYFPYRYGQALWAFMGGMFGDDQIHVALDSTLIKGLRKGIRSTFGMTEDSLSAAWQNSLRKTFRPQLAGRTRPEDVGEKVIAEKGGINLSPVISPDGEHVAYIGGDNPFTLDLLLADAHTGEHVEQLASSNTDAHFDALRFINSSGSWFPDSRRFAFVVIRNGDNAISIVDTHTGGVLQTKRIPGVDGITSLAVSPDGKSIVLAGTEGGVGNLYRTDLATWQTTKLTDDRYSEIQPAWSPDGRFLAFATDRGSGTSLDDFQYGAMKIGLMDMRSHDISLISMGSGIKCINPQFAPDGKSLYCIADPDGISDIFEYSIDDQSFTRITSVATGVSGLTARSPVLSVSPKTGRMVFTVFQDGGYNVYGLDHGTAGAQVASTVNAGALPPVSPRRMGIVEHYLHNADDGLPAKQNYQSTDYSPALHLSGLGQFGIGVGADRYGTSVGGGASLVFSDMLQNHILGIGAQINGTFKDFGGQATYLNLSHRLNWGAAISHIPYLSGGTSTSLDTVTLNGQRYPALDYDLIRQRVFSNRLTVLAQYPLSRNRRFEFSAGYHRISYDVEVDRLTIVGGAVVSDNTMSLPAPSALNLFEPSVAYTGDYSFAGFTSPVSGSRFRLEVSPSFGSLSFLTILADYRKYFFMDPFTFAVRLYHEGRYLGDAEDSRLAPLFLGYQTFVRGYDINSFSPGENGEVFNRLVGSRMAMMNAEFRIPLVGNEQFGILNFPILPTEIALFLDGGVAWTAHDPPVLTFAERSASRIPVFSAGGALRVNIAGYITVQGYYAFPFQRPDKRAVAGFVISPGW